jgi:hypothetical protein
MTLAPFSLDLAKTRIFCAISWLFLRLTHGTTWGRSQPVSPHMP